MALFTKLPNWVSILITVVATIIVVGLVAWGAYTLVKSPPPELPEGEEAVEPEKEELLPEEPEDEFADWKIYRNEEYGFEMKYPEGDYQFRDFAYSFRLEDSSDKPVIEMEILSDQPDKKSFEDFAVDAVKDSCGASGPPGGDWYCTEIIEQNLYTNKSNITSYEIFMTRVHELRGEVEEIGPEGGFIFEIPGPVDKRAIYLKIGSYSYSADNLELLKKMVDTFKFLD